MRSSPFQPSAPTKESTHSLRGRIRAIKNPSDSGSYTDSDSDTVATGYAKGSPDNEKHQGKESASGTSGQTSRNDDATVSFGALVKAQASIGKRNRSDIIDGYADGHGLFVQNQRHRNLINNEVLERRAGKRDTRNFSRASKHAPAELSSKKAVSRKREVVPTQKLNHRDPRFEPSCGAVDEIKLKKAYSFLDTYRDSEMLKLKSAIRRSRDKENKEKLKRALLSMESRKKAQKMKEQQQEVLRKHRKEEKPKIEQGKRPFYLKKAEQKRMTLVEIFEGMNAKQVDRLVKRRRKRKAAKERKGMPDTRGGQSWSYGI